MARFRKGLDITSAKITVSTEASLMLEISKTIDDVVKVEKVPAGLKITRCTTLGSFRSTSFAGGLRWYSNVQK